LTNLVVLGGGVFGWAALTPHGQKAPSAVASFANWDGGWYASIAEVGYSYRPGQQCGPAFFPAFPLLGKALSLATGWDSRTSLLIVSQVFLLASFMLTHRYVRRRFPADGATLAPLVVTVFGAFPATFFYHMVYTESLFFFVVVWFLHAVECRASLVVLGLIAGLATATRGAGLGLVPALTVIAWQRSRSWASFVGTCACLLPLAGWGLLAYIGYLNHAVGEPLAFIKAQEGWNLHPGSPASDKYLALATFEPVWGAFIPGSRFYFPADPYGYLSASAINASVFVLAILLCVIGYWKRWLNAVEFLASAGMLGVTYLSKAFDSNMLSFARYASATPPMYVSLALILRGLPALALWACLMIGAGISVIVAALFCAGYHVI
jgi:hypothetical protein